jgi:hypothetical protein
MTRDRETSIFWPTITLGCLLGMFLIALALIGL